MLRNELGYVASLLSFQLWFSRELCTLLRATGGQLRIRLDLGAFYLIDAKWVGFNFV